MMTMQFSTTVYRLPFAGKKNHEERCVKLSLLENLRSRACNCESCCVQVQRLLQTTDRTSSHPFWIERAVWFLL